MELWSGFHCVQLIMFMTLLVQEKVLSQDLQCGSVYINSGSTLCCDGLVYVKSGVQPACCGHVAYDNFYFTCCQGNTQKRQVAGVAEQCCHNQAYNPQQSTCSNGLVLRRRQEEVGSTCCRTETGWACCSSNKGCCASAGSGSLDVPGFKPVCCHLVTTSERSRCCSSIIDKTGVTARCCHGNRVKPPSCCRRVDNSVGCCEHRPGYSVSVCCPGYATPLVSYPDRSTHLGNTRYTQHHAGHHGNQGYNSRAIENAQHTASHSRVNQNRPDNSRVHPVNPNNSGNNRIYPIYQNQGGSSRVHQNQPGISRVYPRQRNTMISTQHIPSINSKHQSTSYPDCCHDPYPRAHCCENLHRQVTKTTVAMETKDTCCTADCCRQDQYRSKCCRTSPVTCCLETRQHARDHCCIRVQYNALCCSNPSATILDPNPDVAMETNKWMTSVPRATTTERIPSSPLSCCKAYQVESCCSSGLQWSGTYPLCCDSSNSLLTSGRTLSPDDKLTDLQNIYPTQPSMSQEEMEDELLESEQLHRIDEARTKISSIPVVPTTRLLLTRKALCSGVIYDTNRSMCCRGVKQPKRGPQPACCGTSSFDTTQYTCCNGQVETSCSAS